MSAVLRLEGTVIEDYFDDSGTQMGVAIEDEFAEAGVVIRSTVEGSGCVRADHELVAGLVGKRVRVTVELLGPAEPDPAKLIAAAGDWDESPGDRDLCLALSEAIGEYRRDLYAYLKAPL